MAGKRAVVLGGAGFLGSHLCDAFLARGDAVVCVDNFITGARRNIEHLLDRRDFTLIEADITEPLAIPGPVHRVLNFASPASPIDYAQLPVETLRVGSLGTEHGLLLAKEKGARFLQASTSEVYGDPLVHPQAEDYFGNVNPIGPRSCYDEAKRYGEALCMAYARARAVDVRLVRIFNTYGPRMRLDDGRVVPAFISQLSSAAGRTSPSLAKGCRPAASATCPTRCAGFAGYCSTRTEKKPRSTSETPEKEMTMLQPAERGARRGTCARAARGGGQAYAYFPLPRERPQAAPARYRQFQRVLGWGLRSRSRRGSLPPSPGFGTTCFARPTAKADRPAPPRTAERQ